MKHLKHTTAKASYYNTRAYAYDELNEDNSRPLNELLGKILTSYKVRTILDLTCGTGSQVFYLASKGFQVVGSDISRNMLKVAKAKAKLSQLKVKFLQGDCRTLRVGSFNAVLTIFNSIGHLTREDFELTLQNISQNLNSGGLYIFDIFNLDYLQSGTHITRLTLDWMATANNQAFREVQFSTISDDGILASYSTYIHQEADRSPTKISKGYVNTLQVYSAAQLHSMLTEMGFQVLTQTDIHGGPFSTENSERILTVAQKI